MEQRLEVPQLSPGGEGGALASLDSYLFWWLHTVCWLGVGTELFFCFVRSVWFFCFRFVVYLFFFFSRRHQIITAVWWLVPRGSFVCCSASLHSALIGGRTTAVFVGGVKSRFFEESAPEVARRLCVQ